MAFLKEQMLHIQETQKLILQQLQRPVQNFQLKDITDKLQSSHDKTVLGMIALDQKMMGGAEKLTRKGIEKMIKHKERQMQASVKILDFETAALLRDELKKLVEMRDSKADIEAKEEDFTVVIKPELGVPRKKKKK